MKELIDWWLVPAVKVQAWLGALCSESPLSQHTCADLMKIDTSRVNAATETASLTEQEVLQIKMALGTPSAPFEFKDKVTGAWRSARPLSVGACALGTSRCVRLPHRALGSCGADWP